MLSCPLQVAPARKITEVYKLSILDGREDYRLSILDGRKDYRLSTLDGREDYRLSILDGRKDYRLSILDGRKDYRLRKLGGRITEQLHTGSWQYIEAFDNVSSYRDVGLGYLRVTFPKCPLPRTAR